MRWPDINCSEGGGQSERSSVSTPCIYNFARAWSEGAGYGKNAGLPPVHRRGDGPADTADPGHERRWLDGAQRLSRAVPALRTQRATTLPSWDQTGTLHSEHIKIQPLLQTVHYSARESSGPEKRDPSRWGVVFREQGVGNCFRRHDIDDKI